MKIGYPCINNSVISTATSTFRLASYSESRLIQTIKNNLSHLTDILKYNVKNNMLFFRITSKLIPFASHPICKFDWSTHFQLEFEDLGDYIQKHNIRISMHPDQFVIFNSPSIKIVDNSIRELRHHCKVLDAMCLDQTAKVQIHIGGVYRNKLEAIERFIKTYNDEKIVDNLIRRRLVIENDDHLYNLKDCLFINQQTGIPIVFDIFHHQCFSSNGEPLIIAIQSAMSTWKTKDGLPMIDYSNQSFDNNGLRNRKGKHSTTIDLTLFRNFLKKTEGLDFDIMLELKDKEKSALKALDVLSKK